ncbi:hypothetical protein V1512DRAFT_258604 [Lipomyces arxii]|uniref:uncharacterized protein n=1 Tax=Lipomyces arxii TaxID=56418 RepID=UPI0034CF40E7
MSALAEYVGKTIVVITSDGRLFTGLLQGYDQTTNMILESTKERVISVDSDTKTLDLGLYLLRGESVALCGLVDDSIDNQIDWEKVRGVRIGETKTFGR